MTGTTGGTMFPTTKRGRRTQRALVNEALRLFADRGFDAVTVDEICAAAGVAKGTYYRHFRRKDDVFFAAYALNMEGVTALVTQWLAEDLSLTEVIDHLIDTLTWLTELDPRLVALIFSTALARPRDLEDYLTDAGRPRDLVAPVIEASQARGDVRTDLPLPVLSHTMEVALMSATLRWAQGASDRALGDDLRAAAAAVLDGIRAR